jgi:hypothetical protein
MATNSDSKSIQSNERGDSGKPNHVTLHQDARFRTLFKMDDEEKYTHMLWYCMNHCGAWQCCVDALFRQSIGMNEGIVVEYYVLTKFGF